MLRPCAGTGINGGSLRLVTPAKAESHSLSRVRRWFPAFAGMTDDKAFSLFSSELSAIRNWDACFFPQH